MAPTALLLLLAACALQRGAQAGGPQDQPNPDCEGASHVVPAECLSEATMAAYIAYGQFLNDNPGPEPPAGGAKCQQLYDDSSAKCVGQDFCSAVEPTATAFNGMPDAQMCPYLGMEMGEDACNAGCAGPGMCTGGGCQWNAADPACATVVLTNDPTTDPTTCTDAGTCTYVRGADMTSFCEDMLYVDTGPVQAWAQGELAAGTSVEDLAKKQLAVANMKVGDFCPLFCGTCAAAVSEPWQTCQDDPLGFFSAPEFYWPPPDCPTFVGMMMGGDCTRPVEEVTRFIGQKLNDFCPATCGTCPELPPADLACEACPPGKWASDIPTWTEDNPAGIRAACEDCPQGMYRSFFDAEGMDNTRCGACPIGRYNTVSGASTVADCLDCQPAECFYFEPDYPLKMTHLNRPAKMMEIYMAQISLMAAELVDDTIADTYPARHQMAGMGKLELGHASLYQYTDRDEDMDTKVKQLSAVLIREVFGVQAGAEVPEAHLILASINCQMPVRDFTGGCGRIGGVGEHAFGPENLEPLTVRIYAEANPSPQPFQKLVRDISNRVRTSAYVDWEIAPQVKSYQDGWDEYGVDPWQFDKIQPGVIFDAPRMPHIFSPDVAPLVQEVVAMDGWAPGNAIVFIFEYVSGTGIRYTEFGYSSQFDIYSMAFPLLAADVPSETEMQALRETCGGYGEAPGTSGGRVYPEARPGQDYIGRTTCPVCKPGEFDHDLNSGTACEKCPSGTYSNKTRAITCELCPLYSVSMPGSTSPDDCIPLMKVEWDGCEPCKSMGGSDCPLCPRGFQPEVAVGQYDDYNECSYNNGACDPRVQCTNTQGSWTCGACPPGLIYNEENECVLPTIADDIAADVADQQAETVVPATTMTLGVPLTALEGPPAERAAFIDSLTADLALSLDVDASNIVISNLAAAEVAGRRLESQPRRLSSVEATFELKVLGPAGLSAMDSLSEQLADPTSELMQQGTTSALVGMTDITLKCPPGKRMGDGESLCRSCGPSSFTTDSENCEACLVHFGANSISNSLGDGCECREHFYDTTTSLAVCFDGGFEQVEYDDAVAAYELSREVGNNCMSCPTDAHASECFSCAVGGVPAVKAGYIHVKLPASRRSLATIDFETDVLVHRCNSDMELGEQRCPANPESQGQCSTGYAGLLCNSCDEDYGMKGGTTTCEPCEESNFTAGSAIALVAVFIAVFVIIGLLVKHWHKVPGQHLIRSAFVPGRIIVTYCQVTSQLGDVLNFPYPPAFQAVVDVISPIIDFWGMLFRILAVSPECMGLQGFSNGWVMRVFVLPVVLCLVVMLVWCVEKSQGNEKANSHAKGNLFLAIFFSYPTICATAFKSFICKALTTDISVLEADDTVLCEDSEHQLVQVLSLIVTVVFAIGLPVCLLLVLVKKAHDYAAGGRASNEALTRRVAEELKVDDEKAEYIIRDLVIGADYGFVMDAYDPKFLYWEAIDML